MKVYLITSDCDDGGVYVHAVETDREKAEKLYKVFHDVSSEVCLEEYDTDGFADLIHGKIHYCVAFRQRREPQVSMAHPEGKFPRVKETPFGINVYVEAASKDEAYQKAVEIHRNYVTEKYFR